jgi:23S rRNA (uridine2552-2'-O)-methyltransferase
VSRRVLHDHYTRLARAEGYPARSAYKLIQVQERWRVLRPDDRVLDLGCAPGSWLLVASRIAGQKGLVVGVDLEPVEIDLPPNVRTIRADVFDVDPARLREPSGGPFDVLLSDMAPRTSGHGDEHLSDRLCRRALEIARAVLRPGGHVVLKVLEGEPYPALRRDAGRLFDRSAGYKPAASRSVSREIYLLGLGWRGTVVG